MDMEAGASLLLQSGIIWVMLFLVGTLIATWFLVFYWQYEILSSLKDIPSGFDQIQAEVKGILLAIQSYSPDDPPPYGSLTAGIIRQVDTIANRLTTLNIQFEDIQNQLYKLNPGSWRLFISSPFYIFTWYRLERQTSFIKQEIVELQNLIQVAWTKVNDLEEQAWRLALRVRTVIEKKKDIHRLIDHLSDQKLYGDTFELILEKEDRTFEALEKIPHYFILADEANISDQTSKADVRDVHRILSETEPILEEMQDKLTYWAGKYESLVEKAIHHRDHLVRIEQLINLAPEGMIVEPERKQLLVLGDTIKVLTDTLLRLEVESIDPVEQELDQVRKSSNDIAGRLRQGYREFPDLGRLLDELSVLQGETTELFENLLTAPIYPIVWDRSQNRFVELNKRITELGGTEKRRSLQEIDRDLVFAQEILVSLKAINDLFHRINGLHRELINLFESDEIQQGLDRFEEYYRLASKIAQYNPDNWTRADSASTYLKDVQNVETEHREFLERDHTNSLPESEVNPWLQKADQLVETHKYLRLRSEKLRARQQFIQVSEKNAKEEYESVQKALTQAKWLVNSNLMLKKLSERDIKRLSLQSAQCGDQLSKPQSGVIENKVRVVQSLKEAMEDAGHGWLERLNLDIDQRSTMLAEKIEMLRKIASLDDPAIDKVQRLLAQEAQKQLPDQNLPSFHLSLEDMISELKQRSLTWQEMIAAQKELEEIVETPLLDAFNHAEAQRKLAIDAMTKAASVIHEQRSWPPCTVSISDERMELSRLESVRNTLVSQNTRAIWAVRQYGELAASYQTLAGKIERSSEWAQHEQKRITDLESQIDRLIRQLQKQEQMNAADPEMVEQIRRLRAQAKLSMERQKQNWILPSPDSLNAPNYEEILQNMIEIVRMLRSFTVKMKSISDMPNGLHLNSPQPNGDMQDEKI